MSAGLRMELTCSVQEKVVSSLLLQYGLSNLPPKRQVMAVGEGAVEPEEEDLPWTLLKTGRMVQ